MQRAKARAIHHGLFGAAGFGQRLLVQERDERVEAGLGLVRRSKDGAHVIDRGEHPAADEGAGLGRREVEQVAMGHGVSRPMFEID